MITLLLLFKGSLFYGMVRFTSEKNFWQRVVSAVNLVSNGVLVYDNAMWFQVLLCYITTRYEYCLSCFIIQHYMTNNFFVIGKKWCRENKTALATVFINKILHSKVEKRLQFIIKCEILNNAYITYLKKTISLKMRLKQLFNILIWLPRCDKKDTPIAVI